MTISDYSALICQKLGQTDDTSVALCNGFLAARYRMIWDSELWRDTQLVVTASTSGMYLPFPDNVERIVSIQGNGTFLDPVDSTFVNETESALFSTSGIPKFYEDFTDTTDGLHKLRLFPYPASYTTFLIVGKQPAPILAPSDTPTLRNVFNALLAFGEGDMLERQRQYAKAQAKFQEAATHLTWMKGVESDQADKQRQNKTLSANGTTLGDLIDDVASRIGDFAPATRIRIKQMIRRGYESIWNTFLWRETIAQASASITTGGIVPLPDAIERTISVRYGTGALLATEQEILFDVEPSTFDQAGFPTSFIEQRAADGTLQVVLNPPVDTGTVVILGKRTLVPLTNEADTPLLRNVSNALILGATADMLFATPSAITTPGASLTSGPNATQALASDLKQAAMAAIQDMQSLQNDQSMRARRSRSLTVAGNSLAELTDAVCARCGVWDLESLIMVREFLRRQYQAIWDSRPWKESNVIARVATDGQTMILPDYMERVINVLTDTNYTLLPRDLTYLFAVNPLDFTRTGQPYGFSILTSVGVRMLPRSEPLTFVSSDAGDKGVVMIRGESAGLELFETLSLNGTTPVSTVSSYDVPLTVAKPLTAGTVTVTGATTGNPPVLVTLLPTERERKHIRLWLRPASPNCGMQYLVLAKRRIQPLINDSDTPMLRQCQDALIHAAAADMFTQMGKADMAQDARAQAAAALTTLVDLETDQGANVMQIVPYVEPSYSWSGYDSGYGGADGWLRW